MDGLISRSPIPADGTSWLPAASILFYVVLRIAGLANSPEFEDHDSPAYLHWAETLRSADWRAILNMDPDATILYPLLTALLSLCGLDIASAARSVSLLASIGLAVAVYFIGRRVAGVTAGSIAILLLAVNPFFIRFSYSILSEPLYVCIVTFVVLVFLRCLDRPTLGSGILLGVLCGLAFMTRIEGVLLVLALPAIQLAHRLFMRNDYTWRRAMISMTALASVFLLLSAPHIWRTSYVMDTFSINGRTVWSKILNTPDGKSYDEKIYGLDFDPAVTNMDYLQRHPEVLAGIAKSNDLWNMMRGYKWTITNNLETLHDKNLAATMGLLTIAFALLGLVALLARERRNDALVLATFLGVFVAAPLLHNVIPRHIAALGPLIAILAATGIIQAARMLTSEHVVHGLRTAVVGILFFLTISAHAFDLERLYLRPDNINPDYETETLRDPAMIMRKHAREENPVVVTRLVYVGYYANARTIPMPYTDFAGLMRYCELNNTDFLFINHSKLADYPFMTEIGSARWKERFEHLHETTDPDTDTLLSLYKVRDIGADSIRDARDAGIAHDRS